MDNNIRLAGEADVAVITRLLNISYRGESSKAGWTTEAHLIAGEQRATDEMVLETLKNPGSVFLLYQQPKHTVSGCVNLQLHGKKIYLGMFSVSPEEQGNGIGKKLLQAAEIYARSVDCHSIYMTVISVRKELIDWYLRHGYQDTGERKAFEEDHVTGKHLQQLEFAVLEKPIV